MVPAAVVSIGKIRGVVSAATTTAATPAFVRFGMTAGTSATRRSPGKLSRGTPTIMKLPPLPSTDSNAPNHTLMGGGSVKSHYTIENCESLLQARYARESL